MIERRGDGPVRLYLNKVEVKGRKEGEFIWIRRRKKRTGNSIF